MRQRVVSAPNSHRLDSHHGAAPLYSADIVRMQISGSYTSKRQFLDCCVFLKGEQHQQGRHPTCIYIYLYIYIYESLYTYIYIFMIVIRIRLCCLAEIPAGAIRCVGSNIDGHALRGSSHFANDAEPINHALAQNVLRCNNLHELCGRCSCCVPFFG